MGLRLLWAGNGKRELAGFVDDLVVRGNPEHCGVGFAGDAESNCWPEPERSDSTSPANLLYSLNATPLNEVTPPTAPEVANGERLP
jgi:hypothetical protein